jgi:hypothetical protein
VQGHVQQQRAQHTSLGRPFRGGLPDPFFQYAGCQPLPHEFLPRNVAEGVQQERLVDMVEGPLSSGVHDPRLPSVGAGADVDSAQGIVTTAPGAETVTTPFEPCLPGRFQDGLDLSLAAAVEDRWNPKRSLLAVGLGNVPTPDRLRRCRWEGGQLVHQLTAGLRCLPHDLIDARRVLACVDLRYPPDTQEAIGVATQQEFLERANSSPVVRSCRPKDAVAQVTDNPVGLAPVEGVPVGLPCGSVC